jgi:isocitrate/isopropylmalate dehydrogenase
VPAKKESRKRIAVIAGDGIGQEVIPQAVKVIQASGADVELTNFDWGADRYLRDQVTVPPDGFVMLGRDFDAILVGAFGDPRVKSNLHAKEILLGMRFKMDLYANVRPVRLLDAGLCPLKGIAKIRKAFTRMRAASSSRARRTKSPRRKTSTRAKASSALFATRSNIASVSRNSTARRATES